MNTTKPDTLPLFVSLAAAGWKIETGDFGCNGHTKIVSTDYRIGHNGIECRQLRATHPSIDGFMVIFSQHGDRSTFSVESIAGRKVGLNLGRTYFYPGCVDGDMSADAFRAFLREAYERVYAEPLRQKLDRLDAHMAAI